MAEQPAVPFLDLAASVRETSSQLEEAALRVIASGRYVGGDELMAFERAWATYCERSHCVGTGNGLDALALSLRALGVGSGDEVIVPSFTFIATWLAVSSLGAVPVPVEPRATTANLDPDRLDHACGPGTRAIVPVHLYGQPAEMDAICAIAVDRGVAVVEDAAQAHGARWQGRQAGSLGSVAAAFSFYPAKNLGALGDGGAVVTDDAGIAERVRSLGNYGSTTKYEHELEGVNSRLDPLQAAMLAVRLECLNEWNSRRRGIARRYLSALADLDWLELPVVAHGAEPVWHLFVVRCDRRDDLRAHMARHGIETGLHYPKAPHRTAVYRGLSADLPIADALASRSLSLPIGPHMPDLHVEAVIGSIRAFR